MTQANEKPTPPQIETQPMQEQAPKLVLGELDGRYEVLEAIGAGGMSIVYRARHRLMGTDVAIKVLQGKLSGDKQHLQRFQIEAKANGKLDHSNVIKVLDFGVLSDGSAFLVMDYAAGRSLSDIVKAEGKVAPEDALPIFSQICAGMQHAHERGVLHRDLKPSNVIVVEDGKRVKLVDFGIAKMQFSADDAASDPKLTATGEVFGSPYYMSPEHCMGQAVDARSDVYSMGCLMYEVLTGRLPVSGANVLEVIHRQVNETPPPVSDLVEGPLAERLSAVVEKAVEKDPDQRYQSFAELEQALHAVAAGIDSGTVRRLTSSQTAPKKNHALILGGAFAAVAVAVGAYFAFAPHAVQAPVTSTAAPTVMAVSPAAVPETGVPRPVGLVVKAPNSNLENSALEEFAKNKDLTTIEVGGNPHITTDGIKHLVGLQNLQRLQLDGTGITNDSLQYLARIPHLRFLSIGNTKITPEGFATLAQFPELSEVWLLDMKLKDADLNKLPNLPGVSTVKLDANPALSNKCVSTIAKKLPNLQLLAIRHTAIDDAAIPQLAKMSYLKNLRVAGSAITRDGRDKLFKLHITPDTTDPHVPGTSQTGLTPQPSES